MKIFLTLIIIFITHSVFARSQMVSYSEAVDVFEITDNLSKWHPNSEDAYHKFWVKKFGLKGDDYTFIERYKEIRSRYKTILTEDFEKESLFSNNRIPLDFFSNAFYTSRSVGEALNKLKKKLKPEEMKFLMTFYKHYKEKISVMVKESTLFGPKAKSFDKSLKKSKAKSLLKKIGKFFNKKGKRGELKFYYVWWPKEEEPKISSVGKNIIIRYHPIEHLSKLTAGKLMEAAVLAYTSSMLPNQKLNFSKQFNSICVLQGPLEQTQIFERPLALAMGPILLSAEQQKKNFDLYRDWTIHPWGNVYAKMLYPLVSKSIKKNKLTIGAGDFITKAAKVCHELVVLKDLFSTFKSSNN